MPSIVMTIAAGQVAPLGEGGALSGIDKHPVAPPWRITPTGIAGDAQGDLKRHGGPEKAVHHYPFEHYAAWTTDDPALAPLLTRPSAFGENLSTTGMTEASVCIGDIYRLGDSLLQLSQGRQPCWKLNLRFDRPDMARRVQDTGRTGWYYRVLQGGVARPGDRLELVERIRPDWPLSRLIAALYQRRSGGDDLAGIAAIPELAPSWRNLAAKRLRTGTVEDWTPRLDGGA